MEKAAWCGLGFLSFVRRTAQEHDASIRAQDVRRVWGLFRRRQLAGDDPLLTRRRAAQAFEKAAAAFPFTDDFDCVGLGAEDVPIFSGK